MMASVDALFNSNYLPARLLHRDQELAILSNLFCQEDPSTPPLNVLVHGSFGIGRTTLLRYFGLHELTKFRRPFIPFHHKHAHEIVNDTLLTLYSSSNTSTSIPEKWTLIKRLIRKAETPLVFTLDDVDFQTIEIYGKFLQLCKENGVSSMATAPRYFPRQLKSETSRYLDVSLELEPFSDQQLLDIVRHRVAEIYPEPVPAEVTEFMADLICMLDFQRPATAVDLLQNLHPLISPTNEITAEKIRRACLASRTLHYDFWSGHLSNLTDLDATTVLLLQAVGQYFINHPGQIYVTKASLFRQYQQVSEEIGLQPTGSQFSRALNMLLFQDLILRSRYMVENYFTLLPAEGYLEIVELLLGDYQLEQ
ncbi:MAG: hypothetical protein ACFFAL_10135 [Promethearchaeota archaeon]